MATYVRQGTGTLPSATDADVTGTIELDNTTVPGDFDADAVNSVRIQMRLEIGSGTFQSGGAEFHTVRNHALLTLDGVGTTVADVNAADGILDDGTNGGSTVDLDGTDSSIATGFTNAQWEAMELNPGTSSQWTDYIKDMGADGVLVRVASTGVVVTVTIDYTPFNDVIEQKQFRFRHDDGSETAATWREGEDIDIEVEDTDIRIRIRIMLENDGDTLDSTTDWRLQRQLNSDSWVDITESSTVVRPIGTSFFTDGDPTTQQIGAGTFDAGKVSDISGVDSIIEDSDLSATNETEHEWALRLRSGDVVVTDTIKFRVAYAPNGGSYRTADTLTVTPQITITASSLEQTEFRWRDNDGTETGATWRQLVNVDDTHDGVQTNGIRIRFAINSNAGGTDQTDDWQIYIAKNGGSYLTLAASDWEADETSPDYAFGDPTTQQISSPDGFRAGEMVESSAQVTNWAANDAGFEETTEFEYLINPASTLSESDFYDFRVRINGAPIATYTETPRLTIAAGGPALFPPFLHRPPRHVRM